MSVSPARMRMMIRAICLSCDDIPRIVGSRRSSTYGPRTIPVAIMPIMRGSLIALKIAAAEKPTRNIKASDKSIPMPP